MNDRERMRVLLAQQGIFLDEPKAVQLPPERRPDPELSDADRDLIRVILTEAGAPASDLDWLAASCPSAGDALTYEPVRPVAYCARCQGPRVCDVAGCIVCRTVVPEGSI